MQREINHNRDVNLIVLHCSDSQVPAHDNISVIRKWHIERGFHDIGYHYFINQSGIVFTGRPESKIGAHAQGYNKTSIGICLSGRDKFTEDQFSACAKLCEEILKRYNLSKLDIVPHCQLNEGKTCPNFDINEVLSKIVGRV